MASQRKTKSSGGLSGLQKSDFSGFIIIIPYWVIKNIIGTYLHYQ